MITQREGIGVILVKVKTDSLIEWGPASDTSLLLDSTPSAKEWW